MTALAFVPVALLFGRFTGEMAALLAPAVTVWLIDGLDRRASTRRAGLIQTLPGHEGTLGSPWRRMVAAGVPQRLVATITLNGLLTSWLLGELGHRLGGQLHGGWYVWLVCLPVLVVVPTVLLWRRVPWLAVAGTVVVFAAVAALAVPGAVAQAHPTQAKLVDTTERVGVPDGYRVADSTSARIPGALERYGYELPVVAVVVAPTVADSAPPVPQVLRPTQDGILPDQEERARDGSRSAVQQPLQSSTPVGQAGSRQMEDLLLATGWERDPAMTSDRTDTGSTYWLPEQVRILVDADTASRFTRGPWVRAHVVPLGDAVMFVVSTRP